MVMLRCEYQSNIPRWSNLYLYLLLPIPVVQPNHYYQIIKTHTFWMKCVGLFEIEGPGQEPHQLAWRFQTLRKSIGKHQETGHSFFSDPSAAIPMYQVWSTLPIDHWYFRIGIYHWFLSLKWYSSQTSLPLVSFNLYVISNVSQKQMFTSTSHGPSINSSQSSMSIAWDIPCCQVSYIIRRSDSFWWFYNLKEQCRWMVRIYHDLHIRL